MTDTPETTDTPAAPAPAPDATAPAAAAPAAADTPPPAAPTPEPAPNPAAKPSTKAAKPAAEAKTLIETDDGDGQPAAAPADWPDDWREKLAGDDTKLLATLKRFTSPKTFSESYFALKQKLSSGEYQKKLAGDATDEQKAEWRKENGIPDKAEDYDTTLGDGLVIGEHDKPLVNEFLSSMHAANAQPEAVKAALSTYYKLVEQQTAARADADALGRTEAEDALRTEWGNDYRKNVNAAFSLLDVAPAGVKDRLMNGRLADGTPIGNDPGVLKFLAGLAREVNPLGTVVPGAGANATSAIADEIAGIEKQMGDLSSDYWKGQKAEGGKETKMQVRYRELVTARDKIAARAG